MGRGFYHLQALGSEDAQTPYRFRFHSLAHGMPWFKFVTGKRAEGTKHITTYEFLQDDTVEVTMETTKRRFAVALSPEAEKSETVLFGLVKPAEPAGSSIPLPQSFRSRGGTSYQLRGSSGDTPSV